MHPCRSTRRGGLCRGARSAGSSCVLQQCTRGTTQIEAKRRLRWQREEHDRQDQQNRAALQLQCVEPYQLFLGERSLSIKTRPSTAHGPVHPQMPSRLLGHTGWNLPSRGHGRCIMAAAHGIGTGLHEWESQLQASWDPAAGLDRLLNWVSCWF